MFIATFSNFTAIIPGMISGLIQKLTKIAKTTQIYNKLTDFGNLTLGASIVARIQANYTIGISLVVRINRPEPLGHPVSSI